MQHELARALRELLHGDKSWPQATKDAERTLERYWRLHGSGEVAYPAHRRDDA